MNHQSSAVLYFREILKYESDVCFSYFERWSGEGNNEIRITAKPEIIEIFLDFCRDHCLRPKLSMQEVSKYKIL